MAQIINTYIDPHGVPIEWQCVRCKEPIAQYTSVIADYKYCPYCGRKFKGEPYVVDMFKAVKG